MSMKLYFVRHGETYLNKYKKMQGWSDSPLTKEGEEVALQTAERLKQIPFSAIYTSDLGRTIQTARLIMEKNHYCKLKGIQPLKEFRETFFGSFEADKGNVVYEKIAEMIGVHVEELFTAISLNELADTMKQLDSFDDAESSKAFWERLDRGMEIITRAEYEEEVPEILIVTHGNIIRHIVNKISPKTNVFQEIGNSSLTTLEYKNNEYKLLEFNT